MPIQPAIATSQRRNLVLEAIRRLSKTRSWVTQRDLLADLRGQGFDVQKYHILRDLNALALIHPELECHNNADGDGSPRKGVEYGYRWISRDTTPETGLSIPEALSLILVSRHLKQALPATLSSSLSKLFERAEATLDLQEKHGAARWKDLVCVVPPSQPMQPPRVDVQVQQVIHQCLLARERFRACYRNSRGEENERLFSPLGVIVRPPSVYLVAVSDGKKEPRMYAMHRFVSALRDFTPAIDLPGFDIAAYAEEQGNFGQGGWIALKGRVSARLAMILDETPLGQTQMLGEPDEDGWRSLSVRVRDNWQLRWWLLGQGQRIVVTEPIEIREVLRSNTEFLAREYLDIRV